MGSGSKQKQKTDTTTVTTPTPPSWIEGPLKDFTGKINDLAARNPQDFVTGASDLQKDAFAAGKDLLSDDAPWKQALGASAGLLASAASAGPNLAGAVAPAQAAGAAMPTMAPVAQVAQVPGASAGSATGAGATAGKAAGVTLADAAGYTAQQIDPTGHEIARTQLGPAAQAANRSLLDVDINEYMTPELQAMIDATKADSEAKAGQDLARLRAEQMATGAIRGSGKAVAEGIMSGEQTRALATALANMRGEAWRDARDAATSDLNRESETNRANAGFLNETNLEQGRLDASRNEKEADILSQLGIANMTEANKGLAFTAGAKNDRNLAQGQIDADINKTNAQLETQASIASADNATQASVASLNAQTQTSIANMDNQTKVALANAQSANERANLLAQLGVDVTKFNAGEINDMAKQALDLTARREEFNAGQLDKVADRQIDAASILGQLGATAGSNARGDIDTLAGLGETQRDIEVSKNTADIDMMRLLSQLYGGLPINALTGQTSNTKGTTTTTSSPGVLDLLGTAAMGAGALGWKPFASDERLKADIVTIGHDAKGRRWVDFRYRDDPPGVKRRGVIAQEVAKTDPHAVSRHPSGYLQVRYDLLEAA